METGAHALGCTVFAGGTGQTEQQVNAIAELRPAGYVGTPSFLKIIVEKAAEMGVPLTSMRKAMVGGEAFPPSLRDWLAERGIAGYQCYATADLGSIAYETESRSGLVIDEGVIVEIVRPGTGDPVPEGEVGELVVTTLNPDYPLVRFGTGDLSALMAGQCPTGRTNQRIKGWLGRADQTTKIRGMFVHPGQVAEILRRFPELLRGRRDDIAGRDRRRASRPGPARGPGDPRRHQAARRSAAAAARQPAQRRQGHRGRPQLPMNPGRSGRCAT
jgi:phenylacetate-CoA ligase